MKAKLLVIFLILELAMTSCLPIQPTASPNNLEYPTEPILTPAKLDALIGISAPAMPISNNWLSYQDNELGILLKYPADWKAIGLKNAVGVGLYPPDSDPSMPSPSIKIKWRNIPYTTNQPLNDTEGTVNPIVVSGITGQEYQDSKYATPSQAHYIELPYRNGILFFITTIGPSVNLSSQLGEILKTLTLHESGLPFAAATRQIAPTNTILANKTPISGIRASIDLDKYCIYKYGGKAVVIMGNRWDAYSWNCFQNGQPLGGIDMSEACRIQYPDLPIAIMDDRWDAYSWHCSNQ